MSQTFDPPAPPPKGSMYLFDYIEPPLYPGSYKIKASTTVTRHAGETPEAEEPLDTLEQTRYFKVVGPRFALSPADIGGVFPPRNGRGPFEGTLPHIAIRRRTLPWERRIDDPEHPLPRPTDSSLPPEYPVPWMALLLFQDGEYTLIEDVPLENAVPRPVFRALGSPEGIRVTAVEADKSLVDSLMPSIEAFQLLTHVRWVNTKDRELGVEGSDGWFSVVMGSRLPQAGAKFRACLVSLEQRASLVPVNPPPTERPQPADIRFRPGYATPQLDADALGGLGGRSGVVKRGLVDHSGYLADPEMGKILISAKERLVVLYSWQFTCEGDGTFKGLMHCLDVGMIGKPDKSSQPQVADTGHLRLRLMDRAGVEETVWYRGPLVPHHLTRDPLGPYHSADQARRVAPDAGAEDVSYATAFEVGRLLAAADGRLAQELMRWRREAFRQSGRSDVLFKLQETFHDLELPPEMIDRLHKALTPVLAASVIERVVRAAGPIADPTELEKAGPVIGLDPREVRDAWGLASVLEAQAILGEPAALGAEVETPAVTPLPFVGGLDDLAADPARREHLEAERDLLINNEAQRLREEP